MQARCGQHLWRMLTAKCYKRSGNSFECNICMILIYLLGHALAASRNSQPMLLHASHASRRSRPSTRSLMLTNCLGLLCPVECAPTHRYVFSCYIVLLVLLWFFLLKPGFIVYSRTSFELFGDWAPACRLENGSASFFQLFDLCRIVHEDSACLKFEIHPDRCTNWFVLAETPRLDETSSPLLRRRSAQLRCSAVF